MKYLFASDIHGSAYYCKKVLDVYKNSGAQRLILLGDLMDRGPDSYGVLMKSLELSSAMGERFVYLMGNHEDLAVDAADSGDRDLWNSNGGGKTRKSFYKEGSRIQRFIGYLRNLPLYYETDDWICVHAGISCGGPEHTERDVFLWDRGIACGEPYGGKLLIYGHTPGKEVIYRNELGSPAVISQGTRYGLPGSGSICLDTGCVFGGMLSAMVIESGWYRIESVLKDNMEFFYN